MLRIQLYLYSFVCILSVQNEQMLEVLLNVESWESISDAL